MVGVTPTIYPIGTEIRGGPELYQSKDMRVHYLWEEWLLQYPSQSTPIGFRPWDPGRFSSPGTGPTCTKTGQLALSIVHKTSNYVTQCWITTRRRELPYRSVGRCPGV